MPCGEASISSWKSNTTVSNIHVNVCQYINRIMALMKVKSEIIIIISVSSIGWTCY